MTGFSSNNTRFTPSQNQMDESEGPYAPPILWNAETEVCLFYAMRGHKPVGINKHFQMMGIHSKFTQSLGQDVTSAQLWEHLSTMYNLPVLDESDILPFDNRVREFELPDDIMNFGKVSESTENQHHHKNSVAPKESPVVKNTGSAKANRKRTRNVVSSPATSSAVSTKRRRQ